MLIEPKDTLQQCSRIHAFLFYKGRGKKDRVGGWGLTGTPIDISSFYLRNQFLFPLELRRHSETTLAKCVSPLAEANVQQNHLHGNKRKQKIITPEHVIRANRFIVAMELFPFLMKRLLMNLFQGQFAPQHFASLLCIILQEKFTLTYTNRRYLVFFQTVRKLSSPCKRILVCNRAKSSEKHFSIK